MVDQAIPGGARRRPLLRSILRVGGILAVAGMLGVVGEAVVRARIPSLAERMPSAFYTRPVPWNSATPLTPAPLGTLDGSPLERRAPVLLREVPDHLIQAVLAIEDQRFYQHHGLDIRRIGGAFLANVRARSIVQGGSTLTQQLAKNLFLDASRTPLRKLREAALALVLERRYGKPAILEAYLNEVYFGQHNGQPVHGVGAASRLYFGKPVQRMSLAESALLAGMIQAPNRYAPGRNPEQARQRREVVLEQMVEQSRISRPVADRARRAPLPRPAVSATAEGRWFREVALGALRGRPPKRGVAVYTTLDARLQQAGERAIRIGLTRLGLSGVEAALVALDPRTGDVLALVGGRDYRASQFNRATAARRQPGSAFKPVVALTALAPEGAGPPAFTLASIVDDSPFSVSTERGLWEPANYDRQFHGPVTLRQALEYSLNVPFARIGMKVGPDRIAATARRLGITSPLRPVPSLSLGSSEVTLLELARAYGVLAAGGTLAETRVLLGQAPVGQPVAGPDPVLTRAVDPAVAFLVTSALQGVVIRGTGSALNGTGRYPALAGKTGTSNDWRDAWFLAYTPELVVGVWVGYDDGRSMHLTGAGAALPVVATFLADAASGATGNDFEVPDGITEGYALAGGGGPWECGAREYFLAGTEPSVQNCFRWEIPSLEKYRDQFEDFGREAARALRELMRAARGGR
jgi:penicillin-binding protein 1B